MEQPDYITLVLELAVRDLPGCRQIPGERLARIANPDRRAVRCPHHPLRASSSEKHIPAALALLREIQRTGDIFFPERWMDATLDGHRSASATRLVQSFLERLPSRCPERLRRVVLSSADDPLRAGR